MTTETTAAEFQRQLRGLFAVLRSLVRQTAQGRESVEDYAARLEGRIGALARVHEMLMRAPPDGVDLLQYELNERYDRPAGVAARAICTLTGRGQTCTRSRGDDHPAVRPPG